MNNHEQTRSSSPTTDPANEEPNDALSEITLDTTKIKPSSSIITKIDTTAYNGLRGIICVHIMVFHCAYWSRKDLYSIDLLGSPQMSLFFFISGIILSINESRKNNLCSRSYLKHFYQRRFARTIPLFWLSNGIYIPLIYLGYNDLLTGSPHPNGKDNYTYLSYIATIFVANTWFIVPLTICFVTWFVSTIWAFYWIFPFLLKKLILFDNNIKKKLIMQCYIFQLIFCSIAGIVIRYFFGYKWIAHYSTTMWPVLRLPIFIMGMCVGLLRLDENNNNNNNNNNDSDGISKNQSKKRNRREIGSASADATVKISKNTKDKNEENNTRNTINTSNNRGINSNSNSNINDVFYSKTIFKLVNETRTRPIENQKHIVCAFYERKCNQLSRNILLAFIVCIVIENVSFRQFDYLIGFNFILQIVISLWQLKFLYVLTKLDNNSKKKNKVYKFLTGKYVLYLGQISYALYLIHQPVIVWSMYICDLINDDGKGNKNNPKLLAIYWMPIVATVSIVVAIILHKWFEVPLRKILRPKD